MRVLIDDGMQIKIGTGIGKYSKYLYQSLQRKFSDKNSVKLVDSKQIGTQKMKRLKYMFHINTLAYRKDCEQYDIVHYTNYAIPFIRSKKVKYIVTIHDLASFLYPDSLPRMYRMYSHFIIRYAMKHADAILTVSNSVKKEINTFFPEATDKTFAIYPGHYADIKRKNEDEVRFNNEKLKRLNNRPYFLFVGTIEKRKNVGLLLNAFFNLKSKESLSSDYMLVLAGRPGYGYEKFLKEVSKSPYQEDVIFTGYIDQQICNDLYNKACAYLFPTVYEGFGSTQLECMACHTPIILSDIKTNREVSGEYGLFFDLDDESSLVDRMCDIVCGRYDYEEHNKIADKILSRYNWNELINRYIDVYSDTLHSEVIL